MKQTVSESEEIADVTGNRFVAFSEEPGVLTVLICGSNPFRIAHSLKTIHSRFENGFPCHNLNWIRTLAHLALSEFLTSRLRYGIALRSQASKKRTSLGWTSEASELWRTVSLRLLKWQGLEEQQNAGIIPYDSA